MSQRKKAEARSRKQMQIASRNSIRLPDKADSSDVDRYAVNNLPFPSTFNPYFFFFFRALLSSVSSYDSDATRWAVARCVYK